MQNKPRSSGSQGANRRPSTQSAARRPAPSQGANRRPAANRAASRRQQQARKRKNRLTLAIICGILVLIVLALALILRPKTKAARPEIPEVVEPIPVPDPVEDHMAPEEDDGVPPGSSASDTEGD